MGAAEKFLCEFQSIPLQPLVKQFKSNKLILGEGDQPLEVAILTSNDEPKISTLKEAQKKRKNRRASPVLLTVLHGGNQASLCGASGEDPPVYKKVQRKLVENFCRIALKKPDRHKVLKFCSHFLPSIEEGLCGINNKGMLSSHHLVHGVKKRGDWKEALEKSKNISHFEKTELLEKLGFQISQLDRLTYILKSQDKKRALAVLLDPSETHESAEQRFNQLSPVTYAMNKADKENMPWVLMVQDNHIRLYSAKKESGSNHSARTETYIECQPSLLQEENLAYLWLLFSAKALSEGGSLIEILENSKRFSENIAKDLKDRIYDEIVPQIAKGIFYARNLKKPTVEELYETYQMTLTVLFRLLFIAYAEDKDLLPYNTNSAYRSRSLKQKSQELSELFLKGKDISQGDNHWKETSRLWEAIDKGNHEWGVIAYNGGLFSREKDISKPGYEISKISVSNIFFVLALKSLLLMKTQEASLGPVDFRCLGPQEFGTVYEGLLESDLALAEEDLALDRKNIYVPVKKLHRSGLKSPVPNVISTQMGSQTEPENLNTMGIKTKNKTKSKKIIVKKGDVYLRNQSGARKATGSYYTKRFVVEHILDKALEPALKEHFKRLDKLHDREAEKEFFNFFTADIAMGSGHFLVAAIDRIEKAMGDYLDKRPLRGVQNILDKIKDTAEKNLKGISDDDFPVENTKYLARHIARHCIYGVDNNELAVWLAKLSLWTHTFIPGLPLSYFNHNLRCGNSLVGIGTIEEVCSELKNKEDKKNLSFQLIDTEKLIGQAKKPLEDMRKLTDLSLEEVKQGRKAQKEIAASLKDTKALFDVTVFNRIKNKGDIHKMEGWILKWIRDKENIHNSKMLKDARLELKGLKTFHFPISFPEVFLRERPGFDVIVGNPPWEKIKLEEHAFWARHSQGLRGLSQREREAAMIKLKKNYPNLVQKYQSELSKTNRLKNIYRSCLKFSNILSSARLSLPVQDRHSSESGKPDRTGNLKQDRYIKNIIHAQTGSGDSDLYKFFSWRFWNLICEKDGFLGVVLKGSICQAEGSASFRKEIFQKAKIHITTLVNNLGWVFKGVDGIRISILCLKKGGRDKGKIYIQGPFKSLKQFIPIQSEFSHVRHSFEQSGNLDIEPINSKSNDYNSKFSHVHHSFEQSGNLDIEPTNLKSNDYNIEKNKTPLYLNKEQVFSWTDSASLPSLPREDSLDVFLQLRKSPRLDLDTSLHHSSKNWPGAKEEPGNPDKTETLKQIIYKSSLATNKPGSFHQDKNGWRVRPDREMDTTGQKPLMDLKSKKCPNGFWPVWTGRSFNIWEPDTGKYYAYADPKKVSDWLYEKRLNSYKKQKSVYSEFSPDYIKDKKTLSCFKPRIAFRDVGSADRPRTVHVSLIPPEVFLVHKAPYFLFPRGDEKDEAFLLGVLSSIPLDWYARRFISTNSLGFFLLNTFPIPRPSRENPLWKRAVALSGRLASPDKRFAKWAEAVGVECGKLNEEEKQNMIYELDAVVAHLYGLSEKQLIHIFETFHRTWDYKPRLKAVLQYYHSWKKQYTAV